MISTTFSLRSSDILTDFVLAYCSTNDCKMLLCIIHRRSVFSDTPRYDCLVQVQVMCTMLW